MRESIHRRGAVGAGAALVALGLLLGAGGCGLDRQQAPALNGPSDAGVSVDMVAAPDTLNADGVSQSVVRLVLRDQNGKPISTHSVLFTTDGDGFLAPSTASTFVGPVQSGGGSGGSGNGIVMATDKDGVIYVVYVAGTSLRTVTINVRPYGIDTTLTFFRSIEIIQR
jgi:hypothetical protein